MSRAGAASGTHPGGVDAVAGNQDADRCSLATSKPCRFEGGTVGGGDVLATSQRGSLFGGEVEVVRTLAVKFPCHGVLSDHPATRRHRVGGGQRHQGAVGPSAGLWHPVKRRRFARERIDLCPTVLCDHTEHPANRGSESCCLLWRTTPATDEQGQRVEPHRAWPRLRGGR